MGKSSSSSKKIKHSKDSSKLRSVKKKKTKRNKSKKIRRIRDYSDESESSGSDSSLYSTSSEDDYRREKRRSKVSKKKKRSRKRYSSSESDDDDDDDDTRLLKKKKRSKRKEEHVGTKKKKKVSSRKRRKRDSSSSSTGSDNESDDGSESDGKRRTRDRGRLDKVKAESEEEVADEVMTEKSNSRRLKSIVVVSYSYGNDERKEDMVDDHDDESYSYEDKIVDDNRDGDDESGGKAFGYDEFEEDNDSSETSKSSYPENSLKDDDLEAILKQRALENLKRFRGIARKEAPSVSEGEALQTESEKIERSQDLHGLMEQKLCVSAESKDLETSQKISQVVNVNESETRLADKASSGLSSCTTKRKLIRPVLGQESLNLASRKEDAEAESISGSTLDKNVPESSLTLARKNGGDNIEQTEGSSTLNQSPSGADTETLDEIKGGSQPEQKTNDETKDESQYEKKTMTVMRGGEMVQVSYKVYIPKKTSSLGRRQLKR